MPLLTELGMFSPGFYKDVAPTVLVLTARVLKQGLDVLGIETVEQM
jgi:hypothetical protein